MAVVCTFFFIINFVYFQPLIKAVFLKQQLHLAVRVRRRFDGALGSDLQFQI